MAWHIQGVPVTLYQKTETGRDALNNPVYTETAVTVENVLVARPESQDEARALALYGKRLAYTLGIPHGIHHVVQYHSYSVRHLIHRSAYFTEDRVPLYYDISQCHLFYCPFLPSGKTVWVDVHYRDPGSSCLCIPLLEFSEYIRVSSSAARSSS